ncbi:MAG: hypothetical protein SP1CHLAM54_11140 [Chlamydiia bacterium]|nr:hypothetical protein [Chlamydiia bacterium]MCH9616017.1 hypothetical protein [Chlamydiia bacterium]MCH9629040.1 hypothetical protein [Chlamydiia bacterium]
MVIGICSSVCALDLSEKETTIVNHVKTSIERATNHDSRLDTEIFKINGMSSYKVRHLLNNLCSLPGTHYLEIGSFKGSTFVAALSNNEDAVVEGIAIDNFSGFSDHNPKQWLIHNCHRHLGEDFPYKLVFQDCFSVDQRNVFTDPINVYFYDGDHSLAAQEKAFTHFDRVFDDVFIAIVDDWNYSRVSSGTYNAFEKLGYTILYEKFLPSKGNCDMINWWNGFYVAVIRK